MPTFKINKIVRLRNTDARGSVAVITADADRIGVDWFDGYYNMRDADDLVAVDDEPERN